MSTPKNPEKLILRLGDVAAITGLSKPTIHRRYRERTFPTPLRLGPNSIGWRRAEVEAWLDSLPRATGEATGEVPK